MSTRPFRFIDLFAGIGGLRIGFDAIGGQCVFTSEWDKYAQRTYAANFGADHEIAGDQTRREYRQGFAYDKLSIFGMLDFRSSKNS